MEIFGTLTLPLLLILFLLLLSCVFWRYVWFFRNPSRRIPPGEHIVCPADGTVVYVKQVPAHAPVISVKNHRALSIADIVREDLSEIKVLIGVFMSPFDVHYNRAPISGRVEFIRHHPAVLKNQHMGSMHWRSILRRHPIYEHSSHLIHNERTVTQISGHFRGLPLSCYVVQIAGGSVRGIESWIKPGHRVDQGQVFGMIRVGSQVDLVVPWKQAMSVKVKPGDRVNAAESILIE
jgi:phosphatidylserine decarboxylase